MTTNETIEIVLRLLEILTQWPVILLLLAYLFRNDVRNLLPQLAQRLHKVSVGGSTFELSKITADALKDTVESGVKEYRDDPDKLESFVKEQTKKMHSVKDLPTTDKEVLSGCHIIWVDDKPMNNVLESSILNRLGATIITALSTEEALELQSQGSFDLIISDIHRVEDGKENPEAGYELLKELIHRHIRIPLIFYTGSIAYIDKKQAINSFGAADVPGDLLNVIFNALQHRGMSRSQSTSS